jgi:hypothetical protein
VVQPSTNNNLEYTNYTIPQTHSRIREKFVDGCLRVQFVDGCLAQSSTRNQAASILLGKAFLPSTKKNLEYTNYTIPLRPIRVFVKNSWTAVLGSNSWTAVYRYPHRR